MAVYRLTGPDGSQYDLTAPDNATPDQVQQVAHQHIAAVSSQPASVLKRVGRGLIEPVAGLGQDVAHGVAALTDLTPAGSTLHNVGDYLRAGNDQFSSEFEQESKKEAPPGVDWARLTGNAIPAIAGAVAAAPEEATVGLAALAAKGAASGAATAAAQPVDTDQASFAGQKAEQAGLGATMGAAAAPISAVATKGINALAGNVATFIRSKLGNSVNPDAVISSIADTLKAHGIDFNGLAKSVQMGIKAEVQKALSSGAKVDTEAAANKAAFNQLGLNPTAGQATQDPTQFGKELFLRETGAGSPLAQQYQNSLQGLSAGLRDVQSDLPEPMNTPQAGARVMQPLQDAADRGQQLVGRAYDQFKEGAPENFRIDGAGLAQKFYETAEKEPGLRNLPSSLTGALNSLSTGKVPSMSLVDAEAINQEISRQLRDATPATAYALRTFKSMLDDEVQNATQTGLSGAESASGPGTQKALTDMSQSANLGDRLFAARKYAQQRFQMMDDIPALKAAADGSVSPDDFVKKFITSPSAKVEDISNLKSFLSKADPEAFAQVKAQVLSDIRDASTKGVDGKFLQSAYNKQIASLEKSGKLDVLFDPSEINQLKVIGHVGSLLEGPQGVSRTGLGGSAHLQDGLLNLIAKIHPGTAGYLNFLGRTASNEINSASALSPKIAVAKPANLVGPQAGLILPGIAAQGGGLAGGDSTRP